jgi:GMP synthase-like glutamine amidotransferase
MKLMEFACACHYNQKPLIGIGFGHQVIAHSLGGEVNRSRKGWGAGVRDFNIRQHKPWMTPELTTCSLGFSHKEQVDMLPGQATLLAGDSFCLHQMYVIEDHILAIQGHPEYDQTFMQAWLSENKKKLTETCHEQALASLDQSTDSSVVGSWMREFFITGKG